MTRPTPKSTDPKSRPDTGHMPEPALGSDPGQLKPGPPTKHQLALMIWLAVFPTLTILNLVLGDWLHTLNAVTRTFVLATIAVPIVIYILMPQLHRLRRQLLSRTAGWS
jgi:antibiotic biosynthesis monooxygenase (ABM) superfamily enzyme